ncbi:MAG: excinuclease ABC subunit UvrA [Myxococcota bacterium]
MLPIQLEGASTHNLDDVSLEIEPGSLIVLTGVSGAGKSSLAMDTLYAEGQRRFVESFSPYARQFLERLERPPVRRLEPVPAGVAVDRRAPIKSSRSTLATMADLEPYLAALFLREARPVCPEHGVAAEVLDVKSAAARVTRVLGRERALVTYPLRVANAEAYLEVRDGLTRQGFRRLWVRGALVDIDELKPSRAVESQAHLAVVLDRVHGHDEVRISQGIETAWTHGQGMCVVRSDQRELTLRRGLGCPECGRELPEARPGLFSYESPLGACPECRGFGRTLGVDFSKVIPDPERSLAKGAIRPWRGASTQWERAELKKFCVRHKIPMTEPFGSLSAAQQKLVLEGDGSWDNGKFPGVAGWFRWLETRTYKMHVRVLLSRYRSYDLCHACHGRRLNATALSYHVQDKSIADVHEMEVRAARRWLAELPTTTPQGDLVRRELESRVTYLERVGLGYLTLDRQARTLSGGEAQRVTLTAALGTSLNNALFVLDEPTVGLHPSDVEPLNTLLRELSARNNSVLVVEHDPALIAAADRVVELGPGAGSRGGKVVHDAPPAALRKTQGATARALAGLAPRSRPPRLAKEFLKVVGAHENNLKDVSVEIPLGVVCALTGPSGSGKSTLAVDIVYRALGRRLGELDLEQPGAHKRIDGAERIKTITLVDQAPLGRTSRGNAATYTKAWDAIRALYARQPAAQAGGFSAGDFSFNVEGGRCEACAGEGAETVEMQFLADVRLTCPVCKGKRFKEEILAIERGGVTIADVLEMTVDRALEVFASEVAVARALGPLALLGLGYLRLGQPLTTLSGGEAQRLKLSRALGEKHSGALYVLDEPSAGLHVDEVERLVDALDRIVDAGGSVLVVEHDLDVVSRADYVIDMGPDAGEGGGRVVAHGTPDELLAAETRTGRALAARFARVKAQAKAAPTSGRQRKGNAARAELCVESAREHNLREVSVRIPHAALTVVTGPSGSGKSTLAFDVVFAEGQRRFLETLTPYARQFLPTMPRPDVDAVTGVPPSIALEQRTARAGGKSTVATVTEVAHFLRLLYAKLGTLHCPTHDLPIGGMSNEALTAAVRAARGKSYLLAPVVQARKGVYLDIFSAAARAGIELAFADGELVKTDNPPRLVRNREHTIDLVIEQPAEPAQFSQSSLNAALRWGHGALKLRSQAGKEQLLSMTSACPVCAFSLPELDPRWFSFATKQGRCERCEGAGVLIEERSSGRGKNKVTRTVTLSCPDCGGSRLAPIPRGVRVQGERYHEFSARAVGAALERVRSLSFSGPEQQIGGPLLKELERRLAFLVDVGLDYLALDRSAHTLSGGEMQRLRLAAQLGAGLTGALYVLDEPTIGLHPRDTSRLIQNLERLVQLGSTVLVVEHDADTIRAAQHLVDLGPAGGSRGGRIVAAGTPAQVLANPESPTGRALSERTELRAPLSIDDRTPRLLLEGVSAHNLKQVDLSIPLGRFNVVCGVSGSGKSTLVGKVLLPALRQKLDLVAEEPGAHQRLIGFEPLSRAVAVDQLPIGRTPRSVPATFLGIWDEIRRIFASAPEAKINGFTATRFSFNSAQGGRCTTCDGQGSITHEMSFLPDVVTPCPTCNGARFEPRTLEVKYLGLSIGEVLALTAEQAAQIFANHPSVANPLKTLADLGAGYVTLGQGSHTLSGGEAQRLKLALELTASARHEPTLYVLDEPTTGLHLADVTRLVHVLGRLVERGDTLVIIEHHPQVIAGADWLIELGPDGGARGGRIVAEGPPARVAKKNTATGLVVRDVLVSGERPPQRRALSTK